MKLLNLVAGLILLLILGCSPDSSVAAPVQCRQASGAFAGGYICGRTPILEGTKLGQDLNSTMLVTAAASTAISSAVSSNSGEISSIQCSQVSGAFAGGYVCRRMPIIRSTTLGQNLNAMALDKTAASTPISSADNSNSEGTSPIQCSHVSGAFAGGYICCRTPIIEGTKLGQDLNSTALLTAAASTAISSAASSNSEEISPIQCSDVSSAFAGEYICGRSPGTLSRAQDNHRQ